MIQIRLSRRTSISILLICILAIVVVILHAYRQKRFDREISLIRAAGLPTTPTELNQWYEKVMDSENGALVVEDAIEHHRKDPVISRLRVSTDKAFSQVDVAVINEYLGANRVVIEKLHALPAFERSRFSTDLSVWPDTRLSHLAEIKKLAFLLKLDAINQSGQGNLGKAIIEARII